MTELGARPVDVVTAQTSSATSGHATLVSASAGAVGLLSYACTLVMAHLLAPAEYTAAAAALALVGTAGVASMALIPFPLAHVVRTEPAASPVRRDAMAFAIGVSVVTGLVAGLVVGGIVLSAAPLLTALAAGVSALAVFAIAPVWGLLQGESRFARYAALAVGEVAVRLVVSVAAVLLGTGSTGAVGASACAALAVLVLVRPSPWSSLDLTTVRRVLLDARRWAETGGVAAAQAVLSALAVADVIAVALLLPASAETAGYQAVATLAKAPIYVAVGTALVSFPLLRSSLPGEARDERVREALTSFVRLVVPAAAVVATVPDDVAELVLPAAYVPSAVFLPWLVVAGVGLGTTTVLATLLLALRARFALVLGLSGAAVALLGGVTIGLDPGATAVDGLARGVAGGAVAGALALGAAAWRHRPRGGALAGGAGRGALYAVVLVVLLALTRAATPLWLLVVVVLGLGLVGLPVLASRVSTTFPGTGGMRVLHLAFEDPAMPGSGGGAVRTAEIDRRLAASGHRITVVCQRFPGAVDRWEHHGTGWIHWTHPGLGRGRRRLTRLLGYVPMAGLAARHTEADLVVEDFFAPISSMGIPRWTSRPVVGMVQWLNAREKAQQYRLPVHLVERWAVRTHRRLVAVSHGVAEALAAGNPRAEIAVIGNGVDPSAFAVRPPPRGDDVVFVGRLEMAQKGLDLLVDAWSRLAPHVSGRLVLAGTGPDETALRTRVKRLGLDDRVVFAGWVSGTAKFDLVGSARVAAVPSRFETFGIVAAEALAVGTPVVAFDIACLREVVPAGAEVGTLVPLTGEHTRDVAAYADALGALHHDDLRRARVTVRGPELALAHDWDVLADRQEAAFRAAVAAGGRR